MLIIGFSLFLYSLELIALWVEYNYPGKTHFNYKFSQRVQFYFFDWILVVFMLTIVAITSSYFFKKKYNWVGVLIINLVAIFLLAILSELLFLFQRSFIIQDTWANLNIRRFAIGLIVKYKDYLYFSAPVLLVSYLFNYMRNLRYEENRRKNTEILLWKQKLTTLNFQLRPHFLFNTLNNISAIMSIDKLKAQDAIAELSYFYRKITNLQGSGVHTIEEELKILKSYMTIMKSKYGANLILHQNIGYKARSFTLPALTIQTIVENAIKHGYIDSVPLVIELKIGITDTNEILMQISNNGKPFEKNNDRQTGIGNANLMERFRLFYGDAFNYTIKNMDGKVAVKIKFPVKPVSN